MQAENLEIKKNNSLKKVWSSVWSSVWVSRVACLRTLVLRKNIGLCRSICGQSLLEGLIVLPLLVFAFSIFSTFLVERVEQKQMEGYFYHFARRAFSKSVHNNRPSLQTKNFELLTTEMPLQRKTYGHRVEIKSLKLHPKKHLKRERSFHLEK